ncbi:ABC transporter thiamine pyrophosphate-binding lipoprotein p37/Cypl [Mycoplasma sp. 128]
MTKFKKAIFSLLPLAASIAGISAVSAACDNTEIDKWDKDITINVSWINDGWQGTEAEKTYVSKLTEEFNKLKNADEETKQFPDVKFKVSQGEVGIDDLKANKANADIFVASYAKFADSLSDKSNIDTNTLPVVGQTATWKFSWTIGDNTARYTDGSESDPLRIQAENENQIQLANSDLGEYYTWDANNPKYKWNGSVYNIFYDKSKTDFTFYYRGAILMSGDDAQLKAIKDAWDTKDFNKFMSYGLVVGKTKSAGKYRFQVALLAKHFGKTTEEVNKTILTLKENNKVKQGDASDLLGKNGFNIAFDDEGSFNWTKSDGSKFKPSDANAKIRVLTLTEAAPYDIILGRKNLNPVQAKLITKALSSIKGEENTLGVFTGYNYFMNPKNSDLYKKLFDIYLAASDPTKTITDMPSVKSYE